MPVLGLYSVAATFVSSPLVRYAGVNLIGLRRRGFTNEQIEIIHDTYRTIYAQGILKDGIAEARTKYPDSKEVDYICSFIESSKRGIIR